MFSVSVAARPISEALCKPHHIAWNVWFIFPYMSTKDKWLTCITSVSITAKNYWEKSRIWNLFQCVLASPTACRQTALLATANEVRNHCYQYASYPLSSLKQKKKSILTRQIKCAESSLVQQAKRWDILRRFTRVRAKHNFQCQDISNVKKTAVTVKK